jgi:prevent-host-death family protein
MSATVTIEEAQIHLPELIARLVPGEEVVITQNEQPVAKLVGERAVGKRPAPGLGKDMIDCMTSDFDAPLEDFKEYTE